jgi:hypothetical protein
MPRIPGTNVKRRKLLGLGIRVAEEVVVECVRRLERIKAGDDMSEWSMYSPIPDSRIGSLHHKTFKKIKAAWLAGKLTFVDEIDLDPIVDASEQDRQEDLGGIFELLDKSREAGLDSDDSFSRTRFKIMEQAEEMAPEHMWTFQHMRSIGMDPTEALMLLKEYDAISPDRISAQIYGAENRLVNFRRFRRFLFMHYQMHYRMEYPLASQFVIKVACNLRVRGEIDSYNHLVIAGDSMMRYSIWEGEDNLEAFYQSLRYIKRRPSSYKRFVALLDEELKSGHIFSGVQNG